MDPGSTPGISTILKTKDCVMSKEKMLKVFEISLEYLVKYLIVCGIGFNIMLMLLILE